MEGFDRSVREHLAPTLEACGYEALPRARFVRSTATGLRHLLVIDPRPSVKSPRTVRIVIIVNAIAVDDAEGGYLVRYFTGGGVSDASRPLPATSASLAATLHRFASQYSVTVEPWLRSIRSLHDLVLALPSPELDFYRAQVLVAAGDPRAAEAEAKKYLARVAAPHFTEGEREAAKAIVERALKGLSVGAGEQ